MSPGRLLVLASLLACGCAVTAQRPPSPATQLDRDEIARVQYPPGDRFYLLVFGSERTILTPKYTHSWATVVRTTPGPDGERIVECRTISWMPATLDIHPWRFQVEPGVNLGLHESMQSAVDTGQEIAMWGPYEVWRGLYTRFGVQKEWLESGAIGYQCIDTVGEAARQGNGSDCIHAITDADPVYGRARYPLFRYGQSASNHLVRRIMRSPVVIDPHRTHDWLIPALGLDPYPIERRRHRGRVVPYESDGSADLDVTPLPADRVVRALPGGPPPVGPPTVVVPKKDPDPAEKKDPPADKK
jgi:hypothetical protein